MEGAGPSACSFCVRVVSLGPSSPQRARLLAFPCPRRPLPVHGPLHPQPPERPHRGERSPRWALSALLRPLPPAPPGTPQTPPMRECIASGHLQLGSPPHPRDHQPAAPFPRSGFCRRSDFSGGHAQGPAPPAQVRPLVCVCVCVSPPEGGRGATPLLCHPPRRVGGGCVGARRACRLAGPLSASVPGQVRGPHAGSALGDETSQPMPHHVRSHTPGSGESFPVGDESAAKLPAGSGDSTARADCPLEATAAINRCRSAQGPSEG